MSWVQKAALLVAGLVVSVLTPSPAWGTSHDLTPTPTPTPTATATASPSPEPVCGTEALPCHVRLEGPQWSELLAGVSVLVFAVLVFVVGSFGRGGRHEF